MECKLKETEKKLKEVELDRSKQAFRLENIGDNSSKIKFYTGFSSLSALMVCFNLLGPSVNNLSHWSTSSELKSTSRGRKRILSPLNEFFLLLVRLRLGLFEQDIG